MIDEQELYRLGESGHQLGGACRPVDAIIARGTSLRRRRQAVRTVGATAGVVGLIGMGVLVRGEAPTRDPDVRSTDTPAASQDDAPVSPPPVDCTTVTTIRGGAVYPTNGSEPARPAGGDEVNLGVEEAYPVSPADMPEELRVLPAWTPSDRPVTVAQGTLVPESCISTPDHPREDRLMWTIEIGGTQGPVQTGVKCLVQARPRDDAAPDIAGGNGEHLTVNGQEALWGPSPIGGPAGAMALTWQLGPDAIVQAGCLDWDAHQTLPLEDIVRMAESVVPVPADDTRIPDDPRLSD